VTEGINRRGMLARTGTAIGAAAALPVMGVSVAQAADNKPSAAAVTSTGTRRSTMTPEEFEDHCWKDVVSADDMKVYARNVRDTYIGKKPALLAIDLYNSVYRGGNRPVLEIMNEFPGTCGEYAWNAIEPTKRLFAAARKAAIPIIYTTGAPPSPEKLRAANLVDRGDQGEDPYGFFKEFTPQKGDRIIYKERASGFFGTPLQAFLQERGVDTVIVCGESTSGCVRASSVDAYSAGFHVVMAEECCFDRILLTHKLNLFDLHHKYADVMHIDRIESHLNQMRA
jgi:maleamate amidohydrolase